MKRLTNKLLHKAMVFCINNYGISKFKKEIPVVDVIRENSDYYGWYENDDNIIFLNKALILNDLDFAETFIHEYQHYLQSPVWDTRYARKFTYSKHPYEKKAESVAVRDADVLIEYLNQEDIYK